MEKNPDRRGRGAAAAAEAARLRPQRDGKIKKNVKNRFGAKIFFSGVNASIILLATLGRILTIVPGFFRIRLWVGRIPGRSPKFGQKWRFEFWKNGPVQCPVWEPGNVLIGTQEMS